MSYDRQSGPAGFLRNPRERWSSYWPANTSPAISAAASAAIAAAVVAGESLIFVGNRCRCPLTQVAERLGAEQGSVTDIYLPDWFARNLPAIHVPLIVLAVLLHARNLRRAAAPSSAAG
jgi:hypothetical protein